MKLRTKFAGWSDGEKLRRKAAEHKLCGPMTARRYQMLMRFAVLTKLGRG